MKKFFGSIASALMISTVFADTASYNGYTWTYQIDEWHWSEETGSFTTVSKVESISPKPGESFTIPATLGGCRISLDSFRSYSTSLDRNLFSNVKRLEFSNGITEIPSSSFKASTDDYEYIFSGGMIVGMKPIKSGWTSLESVTIPPSVTHIGIDAFDGTPMMTALTPDEVGVPVVGSGWLLGLKSWVFMFGSDEETSRAHNRVENLILDSSIAARAADGALRCGDWILETITITGPRPNWGNAVNAVQDYVIYYQSGASGWSAGEQWGGAKTYPSVLLTDEYLNTSMHLGRPHLATDGTYSIPSQSFNGTTHVLEQTPEMSLPTMTYPGRFQNLKVGNYAALPVYGATSASRIRVRIAAGETPLSTFGAAEVVSDAQMRARFMPSLSTKPYWDVEDSGYTYETGSTEYRWPMDVWENGKTDPTRFWILVDVDMLARVNTGTWSKRTGFNIGVAGTGLWSESFYIVESPTAEVADVPATISDYIRGVTVNGVKYMDADAWGISDVQSGTKPVKLTITVPSAGLVRLVGDLYDHDGIGKSRLKISGSHIRRDSEGFFNYGLAREIEVSQATTLTLTGSDIELDISDVLFYPADKQNMPIRGSVADLRGEYSPGYVKGSGVYSVGETVKLTAVSRTGEIFDHWEFFSGMTPEGADITNPELSFVLTKSFCEKCGSLGDVGIGISAVWKSQQNIIGLPTKAGAATIEGSKLLPAGEATMLKVIPAEGCTFVSWLDGNTDNPRRVVSNGDAVDAVYYAIMEGDPPPDPVPTIEISAVPEEAFTMGVAIEPISVSVRQAGVSLSGYTLSATGLPAGLKFASGKITGTPTKAGEFNVTVTAKKSGAETLEEILTLNVRGVRVIVEGTDPLKGTVTGAGTYAANKTVTLKATAKTGYVFAGWYLAGEPFASGTADYRNPSLSVVLGTADLVLEALFVRKSDDSFLDVFFDPDWEGYNAGSTVEIPVLVESYSLPTVTVSNLPAGLKFDAKKFVVTGIPTTPCEKTVKITAKNASGSSVTREFQLKIKNYVCSLDLDYENGYTVLAGVAGLCEIIFDNIFAEQLGWTISGLPAGVKFDSKLGTVAGAATTPNTAYTVTLTKKEGKDVVEKGTVTIRTVALPQVAVGTFKGVVFRSLGYRDAILGSFTLTASDKGVLKATVASARATYTFNANAWGAVEDDRLSVIMTDKQGNTLSLWLRTDAEWTEDQIEGVLWLSNGEEYEILAQNNAFTVKRYYRTVPADTDEWRLEEVEAAAQANLTLTMKSDGSATLSGKIDSLSVNATAPLQLHRMRDGAFGLHFMPIVTIEKVKRVLSIELSVWMDYTNGDPDDVGRVMIGE